MEPETRTSEQRHSAMRNLGDEAETRAALLAAIIDSSDDAIISNDLDGIVTSWNRGAEKIYGYKEHEIVGQPLSILNRDARPDEMKTLLAEIRAGRRVEHHETARIRKDGKPIYVSMTASPIHAASGEVIGASSVARDITESTRLQHELAETKNLLDSLLQSSIKYSIIGKDLEHRIVSWNEGARRNYGYTAEEVIGKGSEMLHAPEDLQSGEVRRLLARARDTGLAEGEFQRVRKDGTRFTASVVITRRSDASGKHIGYLVMSSDVTAQKVAEEKLRRASQYARSLIEASLDPLVTIDSNGRITDVNEATIQATGVPREEIIGTDSSAYFTNWVDARHAYEQAFAIGSITDFPLTMRHRNGSLMDVLYNASVYRDEQGNVLGVFAAARDVTAQRKAQTELAEQRGRELERLAELERFQRLTVGRELKMLELKKEIADLRSALEQCQQERARP